MEAFGAKVVQSTTTAPATVEGGQEGVAIGTASVAEQGKQSAATPAEEGAEGHAASPAADPGVAEDLRGATDFKHQLQNYLTHRNLSQTKLAQQIGLHNCWISAFLCGKKYGNPMTDYQVNHHHQKIKDHLELANVDITVYTPAPTPQQPLPPSISHPNSNNTTPLLEVNLNSSDIAKVGGMVQIMSVGDIVTGDEEWCTGDAFVYWNLECRVGGETVRVCLRRGLRGRRIFNKGILQGKTIEWWVDVIRTGPHVGEPHFKARELGVVAMDISGRSYKGGCSTPQLLWDQIRDSYNLTGDYCGMVSPQT